MKIDSYNKSVLIGFINSAIQVVLLVVFTAVVLHLTNGEGFMHKEYVNEQVGNIRRKDVEAVGYILSSVVPLVLLRYNSIKYLPLHIVVSIGAYLIYYFIFNYILYYVFKCNILGGFDALRFGAGVFPYGALAGTVLSVIINTIVNLYKK